MKRSLRVAVGVLCAAWLCHGTVVHGQAAAPAPEDPRIAQAFEACQTGKVQAGLDLLTQLYSETQDPDLVTAQGLCFDKNGRHAEAAKLYREYLRVAPNAPATDRAAVEEKLRVAESYDRPPPAAPPPAPVPVPSVAPPSPPPVLVVAPPPQAERPRASLALPLVLAGAGAAALVTGGVLWLEAGSAVDDYKACDHVCTQAQIDDRGDHVKHLDLAAGITAAAGATLAAAGVIVYFSRHGEHMESASRARLDVPLVRLSLGSLNVSLPF